MPCNTHGFEVLSFLDFDESHAFEWAPVNICQPGRRSAAEAFFDVFDLTAFSISSRLIRCYRHFSPGSLIIWAHTPGFAWQLPEAFFARDICLACATDVILRRCIYYVKEPMSHADLIRYECPAFASDSPPRASSMQGSGHCRRFHFSL